MNVSLSAGLSGSYATRKMFSGVNILNYNIFWSTAYNQIMGDGSGGSFAGSAGPFPVAAGGSNVSTGTMYGLIPASQDVAPGSYSDVIVVTVTYGSLQRAHRQTHRPRIIACAKTRRQCESKL